MILNEFLPTLYVYKQALDISQFLLQKNVLIPDWLCERLLASHLGYFVHTCSNKKTRLYRGERERKHKQGVH